MGPVYTKNNSISLIRNWEIPSWLDYYNIDYNTISVKNANADCWYPISLNFWDFDFDYISHLSDEVKNQLSQNRLKLLFSYREADSPRQIRAHIEAMCQHHNIESDAVFLLSGNTTADKVSGCAYFWFFECSYFFDTLYSPTVSIVSGERQHQITCLSRVHKNWREQFVYNVLRHAKNNNYISYGNVSYFSDLGDFEFWNAHNRFLDDIGAVDVELPTDEWRNTLPIKIDSLSDVDTNNHSLVFPNHYQDSYWNIVLETLLETDDTQGVFVTEKTLKPIRNSQPFIVLGCQYTLEYLKDQGYKTFSNVVDESYDRMPDVRQRWYAVYQQTKKILAMSQKELNVLQQRSVAAVEHNAQHWQRSRHTALLKLISDLLH